MVHFGGGLRANGAVSTRVVALAAGPNDPLAEAAFAGGGLLPSRGSFDLGSSAEVGLGGGAGLVSTALNAHPAPVWVVPGCFGKFCFGLGSGLNGLRRSVVVLNPNFGNFGAGDVSRDLSPHAGVPLCLCPFLWGIGFPKLGASFIVTGLPTRWPPWLRIDSEARSALATDVGVAPLATAAAAAALTVIACC